jgi:hypothetical protein
MSSMPLPALHVNPPQDIGEGMQRILAMKGMMQQQQMQGVDLQQKQLQLKDQQALRGLFVKHSGDLDKVIQDAPMAGVSPQTIQQLQLHNVDVKTKTADLVAKQGDNAVKQADLMQGAHDAVTNAPAEQRAAEYTRQVQGLQKMGVDVSQMPPQYPGDDEFKLVGALVKGHKQQVEDAFKAAETAKNTAQGGEAIAQTKKINAEIDPTNPSDPNIRKQKYEGILQKVQSGGGFGAVTPDELAFARSYENGQRKTTTQSDSLGVTSTNTSGPAGLDAAAGQSKGAPSQGGAAGSGKASQPAGGSGAKTASAKDSLVDMIGNYKLNPMMLSRMMAKHPEVIGAVNSKYPDWDQTTYNAKNKMVSSMASGPEGKTLDAINTAMGHIKNLDDAIDALHNGNVTALNNIGKIYNMNFAGKTPEAAFQLIVHRVGPEIANAYIPGGGGQGERMADEKDFDVNLPPQTLHNNAAITVNMLRSKIGAIENRYKNIVGRDDFDKYLTPEAKASLQKMAPQGGGGTGGSFSVKAPNGKTYHFKDQASADAFKAKLPQ